MHLPPAHMDRMGATMSREAIRMPSSAMSAVRRRAHVGSPFAFPWPNNCRHQKRSCPYHSSPPTFVAAPSHNLFSHHPCGPSAMPVPVESQVSPTLLLWVSLLWMKHRQVTGFGL